MILFWSGNKSIKNESTEGWRLSEADLWSVFTFCGVTVADGWWYVWQTIPAGRQFCYCKKSKKNKRNWPTWTFFLMSLLKDVFFIWLVICKSTRSPLSLDCSSQNSFLFHMHLLLSFWLHSCFPIAWLFPSFSVSVFFIRIALPFLVPVMHQKSLTFVTSGPRDPSLKKTPLEHQFSHSTLICPISVPFHGNGCRVSERAPGLQRSPTLS